MDMKPKVTPWETGAITVLSVVALVAAVTFAGLHFNLDLSARDVGGLVMPQGMIQFRDLGAESMRDMAAVDPTAVSFVAPDGARGDRTLEPTIEAGVKVFHLDAAVIDWPILRDVRVLAYAFNHQVPGPRVHVQEGDRVRIVVTNHLPESTTVHWHGLIVPNDMDGPADITQKPIEPGHSYSYEFTVRQAGTYFYHSHRNADYQQALGLYGAFIVDPKKAADVPPHDLEYSLQLQEWLKREGRTYPAMMMEGALPNYFTINGKAYPATDVVHMHVGQRILLRFIGTHNNFIHPMHVHGGPFEIVATDGNVVRPSARLFKDTIDVGPGERYDVIWTAREPGTWLVHCHIPHHTTNNNAEERGAGGLAMVLQVER